MKLGEGGSSLSIHTHRHDGEAVSRVLDLLSPFSGLRM